ncbi:deoxyribonuclease IV [Candidatus Xianfuyuplasma coldseepsis]|uniref:Probable endonuclease 4 n=1 Tax=Candidatus Xianfuyuplasma coldseepsis TaxID=2782163 RepID=A0A7L7KUM4_9MOLU|nr:deoxyribonuclease IV [Xianfuyuplasma coldseepsis]QMS85694.1 deoxyribonuclease IV [Xianfuyuplasma coldseepsis]
MLKIGSHVSMNGNDMLVGAVQEALSYNANSFMIYTGAPQNTRRKPMSSMKIEEAKALMNQAGIPFENIIVHAPYIMNLANGDPTKRQFAVDFLTSEIERTAAIGAKQIVLHPGAHVKQGVEIGIQYIIEGLNKVIENTKDLDVKIALETMAGKGTEVGRRFEELQAIIDGVEHDERLSVCFDTCHTHDAGYDTKNDFDAVIDEFDRVIGKDRISVFHINDSKNPKGAGKDRHENIGFGYLGFDALNYIVNHPDFTSIPKILETPYVTPSDDSKDKIHPPYKFEIEMFRNQLFNDSILDDIRSN